MFKSISKKMIFFRRFTITFVIVALIAVFGHFLFGEKGVTEQSLLNHQIEELETKIDSLQKEVELKKEIRERLLRDTLYIEAIARTRFGMSRKNEKVYYFVPGNQ